MSSASATMDEERGRHPMDVAREGMEKYITNTIADEINEVTLADELARLLTSDELLATYCQGKFWCYDPGRGIFAPVPEPEFRNLLFNLLKVTHQGKSIIKMTKSLAVRVLNILADRLFDPSFFDESAPGFAVPNGFLTLHNGVVELQDHAVSNRARRFIPVTYDENADTSELDVFMNETLPDPERVELVFELGGVALFGQGTKHHVAAIFVGEGANGKGVIAQLFERLIPPEMRSAVPPSEWNNDYQRHGLVGSILNTCGELPLLDSRSWSWMKAIIAGDVTTARPVGGNQFALKPTALHIFSTNQLPIARENGEAIERRFRIIRFPVVVPREKQNPHLADELFERQASALLLRMVEGMQRVVQRGSIANPAACEGEMDHWLRQRDPIKVFLDDCVEQTGNPSDRVASQTMFEAAKAHASRHGFNIPTSMKQLAGRLENLGLQRCKCSNVYWICVRLKNSPPRDGSIGRMVEATPTPTTTIQRNTTPRGSLPILPILPRKRK